MLPEIADALERAGITTPFPIQEMTLSVALMGTDLIGQARTGTGKTLAFGLALLARTAGRQADPKRPLALVLVPTRELAQQVTEWLEEWWSPEEIARRFGCARDSKSGASAVFATTTSWERCDHQTCQLHAQRYPGNKARATPTSWNSKSSGAPCCACN